MMRIGPVAALAVLLLGTVVVVVGCNGTEDNGGGGEASVPLGTAREYTAGDTWDYQLTGTFVASGGGTTPVTPTTATLGFAGTSTIAGSAMLALNVPVAHGAVDDLYVYSVAFTQDPTTHTLTLTGLSPMDGNPAAFDTPLVGPNAAALGGVGAWSGATNVAGFGAFEIDTTKEATENVTVGGETFECYRVTGSKSLDGFPSTFTVWINPQLGAFAKMTTSYTDLLGTTNLTYELSNTTVPLP